MIRLLIAAPSEAQRAGLEALAESSPGVELAGSFPDFSAVEALRPDVVLAAASAGEVAPGPATVLLSQDAEPQWTLDALRAGVRAILPRDARPAGILAAVEAAAAGLAVVDPVELEALLGSSRPVEAIGESPPLTPRELEVLRMMADGAANKIIAWKLGISEHTVKFHVASILTKLNAGTRTEAVTMGIRRGLVLV